MPNSSHADRPSGFDAILARIDDTVIPGDEGHSAEVRFEALRRQLIRFFAWERCHDPEFFADETISRVAAKIQEGHQIQNFRSYVFGVARVVRLEAATRLQREASALVELAQVQSTASSPGQSAGSASAAEQCLQRCLRDLSPEQRTFILRYYGADGAARIALRKHMAEEEGVEPNALRNRALRLRDRLERCCRSCLQDANAAGGGKQS